MIFGISVNTSKENYEDIVNRIQNILRNKFYNPRIKIFLDGENLDKEKSELSFLFVIGGDGTILRNVKLLGEYDLPIIGVNYGTLGFMASVEIKDIERAIEQIRDKNYYIDKRLMIEVYTDKSSSSNSYFALNDIVLTKLPLSRLLQFKIFIDNKYYNTFSGDGLIVSTPTGSTAYSLSAGGPIVSPDIESIVITPICPHSLNAKSLVINSMSNIKLEISGADNNSYVIVDGQKQDIQLNKGVCINRYKRYCSLIRFGFYDYYQVLREKLINRI